MSSSKYQRWHNLSLFIYYTDWLLLIIIKLITYTSYFDCNDTCRMILNYSNANTEKLGSHANVIEITSLTSVQGWQPDLRHWEQFGYIAEHSHLWTGFYSGVYHRQVQHPVQWRKATNDCRRNIFSQVTKNRALQSFYGTQQVADCFWCWLLSENTYSTGQK